MVTLPVPDGCTYCGIPQRGHMGRWADAVGWHLWTEPTDDQRRERMLARCDLERHRAENRAAATEQADDSAEMTEQEREAYVDAVELVRCNQPYENTIVAEIRQRDAAAGPNWRELTVDAADRRILLGLHDANALEFGNLLDDADVATEHVGAVEAACDRLMEHARLLAASDPAGAEGIRRAVNVITRALHARIEGML